MPCPASAAYTAGAVLSFAYEEATPAVDTNVARVIRRAFHPRLGRGAAADRRVWATAEALLPRPRQGRPGRSIRPSWNWGR